MDTYSILLAMHIVFGSFALLSFPLPMILKKGGPGHRRSGWVYVTGMAGVCVTALAIGIWRIFYDPAPSQSKTSFALFLMVIALFSGNAVWSGLRVLRFKNRKGPHFVALDLSIYAVRIGAGVLMAIYGFSIHDPLLSWFPLLPVATGIQELSYWLRSPEGRMHWWFHHMETMFTACIATVTAFAVTAVPRLLGPGYDHALALWLAPTFVLIPISKIMAAAYRKQFNVGKVAA